MAKPSFMAVETSMLAVVLCLLSKKLVHVAAKSGEELEITKLSCQVSCQV